MSAWSQSWSHFFELPPPPKKSLYCPVKDKTWPDTFEWWAKSSKEPVSEGPAVLNTYFCSLSSISKKELEALSQASQLYSMHGRVLDL